MQTQRRQIKFLEREEVERLINTIPLSGTKNLRDRALLEVLFSTGMRIHEALALKLDDVKKPFQESELIELPIVGKGGWQRVVFLSGKSLKSIEDYTESIPLTDKLFPITSRCTQLMIKKRAIQAGLNKHVSPHTMRHSFATDLLGKGVDMRVVQRFLGHRSISSTEVYTHVKDSQLREIHKKIFI